MFDLIYVVVGTGLTAGVLLLVFAIPRGRVAPARNAPWVVGLVILALDTALHVAASIGALVDGGLGGAWFILGTLAFLAVLVVAVLRPRWAGLALLVSAAVVPLALAVGGLTANGVAEGAVPWPVALVTYSVPAAVSGGLLVLSSWARRRKPGDPPEADVRSRAPSAPDASVVA
jgi:hypothetical protein